MIDRYTKLQKITNGTIKVKEKTIRDYPTHWHEFYEIELVLSGAGQYVIDGVEHNIEKNMLFFMTPANFHRVSTQGSQVITVMFMGEACDKSMLFRLSSVFDSDSVHLSDEDAGYIASLMRELSETVASSDEEYSTCLLNCIIGKICRLTHKTSSGYLSKVQRAMLYVQNNFRSGVTLSDAAAAAGVSPSYLSSIFLKSSGINFKEYLNGIRFDYAGKMLSFSDMTVTDICYESGFNDYANFERNFRSRFGMSPKEYRKASAKSASLKR